MTPLALIVPARGARVEGSDRALDRSLHVVRQELGDADHIALVLLDHFLAGPPIDPIEITRVFAAYGIPFARATLARDAEEAVAAARPYLAEGTRESTAPSSAEPERQSQQHEARAVSNAIGGNSSSTQRWNDVPRGTMDEVSSHVRLELPLPPCRTAQERLCAPAAAADPYPIGSFFRTTHCEMKRAPARIRAQ